MVETTAMTDPLSNSEVYFKIFKLTLLLITTIYLYLV